MRYPLVAALAAAMTIGLAAAGAAQETDAGWVPERTPWGHPDLQGVWDQTTGTPLERAVDAGDHTIYIGRVVGVAYREDEDCPPLLYFRGGYRSIAP